MLRASLRLLALSFLCLPLLAACGDDGGTTDAATDSGGGDSAADSTTGDTGADSGMDAMADSSTDGASDSAVDAAVCEGAMEGEPCTAEGTSCGGPCTDVCSFCNILRCESGTWTRLEVFPAPCFDCGPMDRCETDAEYCSRTIAGVPGGADSFICVDLPAACESDATCACLGGAGVEGDCAEPDPGEMTVTIAAP